MGVQQAAGPGSSRSQRRITRRSGKQPACGAGEWPADWLVLKAAPRGVIAFEHSGNSHRAQAQSCRALRRRAKPA